MAERGAELFARAAVRAVDLYEAGFAAGRKPEERIRQSFIAALGEDVAVESTQPALGETTEFRPLLPEWPNVPPARLGGVDLAVRLTGDSGWRYLAEFKWDSLWMVLWDMFKLTHASRAPGVEATFVVAIALERQWAKPDECAELFDDQVIATRFLLEHYEARWRNMDGSSKSRPLTLPRAVELSRVADVPIATPYGLSRLRIASVQPTDAEWIPLDEDCWPLPMQESEILDWPHPEPGPGMLAARGRGFVWPSPMPQRIADDAVRGEDVPEPDADLQRIIWFAASLDGYEEWGSVENLTALGNVVREYFERTGELPSLDLRTLRSCLFCEYRRHHFLGHIPGADATPYIRALVEEIRGWVAARGGSS